MHKSPVLIEKPQHCWDCCDRFTTRCGAKEAVEPNREAVTRAATEIEADTDCDDLLKTMAELKRRGVQFTTDVREEEWRAATRFKLPDGDEVELYQPTYTTRHARVRCTIRSVTRNRSSRKM